MDTMTMVVSAGAPVAGYLGSRVLDMAIDKMAATIIRPCTEWRAHAYFKQLSEELLGEQAGGDPDRIIHLLDEVTKDEASRERVFEYYRCSLLSRSKTVGPRLLALLAAKLVKDNREASPSEEAIAEIAESCTDGELGAFAAYYSSLESGTLARHSETVVQQGASFTVTLRKERLRPRSYEVSAPAGPLSLAVELGRWSAKFEQAGVVQQLMDTVSNPGGLYRGMNNEIEAGSTERMEWSVHFTPTCRELCELLRLATRQA